MAGQPPSRHDSVGAKKSLHRCLKGYSLIGLPPDRIVRAYNAFRGQLKLDEPVAKELQGGAAQPLRRR